MRDTSHSCILKNLNEIINDTKGYVSRDTFKTHLMAVAYIFLWGWDVSISLMLISMATILTHLTLENMPHLIYLCHISYEIHVIRGTKILWRVFVAWFLPGKLKSKWSIYERIQTVFNVILNVIHTNASGRCIFYSINLKFYEKAKNSIFNKKKIILFTATRR